MPNCESMIDVRVGTVTFIIQKWADRRKHREHAYEDEEKEEMRRDEKEE